MPSRIAAAWVAAALALLSPSIVLADVGDYLDKLVVAVSLRREGRTITDPRLYDAVETKPGQKLAMVAVRETIEHLFGFGIFEDVRVQATSTPAGVLLTYDLVPLHPVTRVAFEGAESAGVNEGRLRRIVTERFGLPLRVGRAGEVARVLEDALREVGFLHPRVTSRTDIEHVTEQSTLLFAIEAGERTRIGKIDVDGAPGVPATDLLARLDLATGGPYEREALKTRLDRFLNSRRSRGYYEARASVVPQLTDNDRVVNLRISVTLGPLVRVVFKGDELPLKRRDELVPVEREGSADEDLLEDSSNRVEEYLRAQGYRDASAPHVREEVDAELLVTFTVKKGPLYRVAEVDVSGNSYFSSIALSQRLRVREGQPFSAANLSEDLTLLTELYRREGFASVQIAQTSEPLARPSGNADVPVAVKIAITENARTVVNSVELRGNEHLSDGELRAGLGLQIGRPYVPAQVAIDRDAIQLIYANAGYPSSAVDSNPGISADGTSADVVFTVREGPRVLVDHVLVVGNVRTKTETIERELRFKVGDPLGPAAVTESQRRLAALGLFRRVRITELRHGDDTHRDVLVSVDEAPLTTIAYGGGFEVRLRVVRSAAEPDIATEKLEGAPRASFEIGRRNLFGRNRSVTLFTSASLHPRDSPVFTKQATSSSTGGFGFPEYRIIGQFREPRILGSAADLRVTGTFEQQIRSSFNFSRRGASAEIGGRMRSNLSLTGSYQVQRTRVFDQSVETSQQSVLDRIFPKVLLSSFSAAAIRDTTDDPVNATHGQYFSVNGQLAARAIGSQVGFIKSFLTAKTFHSLTQRRGLVLAASARLGMAAGFPREVVDEQNKPLLDANGQQEIVRELPASERFYAGGDTTVRGFALDQLGVRHIPPAPNDTIDSSGFPLGGNGLVILMGELRVPLRGGLGVVGFVDTGNVFKRVLDINLGELRTAVGFGLRYKSPVGPIRVDLGFKTNRQENEGLTAWFVTFGQAF